MDYYKGIAEIDSILSGRSSSKKITRLFSFFTKKKAFEDYFLKNIKSLKWFLLLKEKDYFTTERAPWPKEIDDKGHYSIPEWNVLAYLERVSEQVKSPGNEQYIDELLEIIRNVSNYRNSKGQHIDNYRTWWYFVKILLNIPNDQITDDIINLIPIWFGVTIENREISQYSKFDTPLPGSEIAIKLLPKFLESDNAEEWKKAERIIEIISAIKWKSISEEREVLGREEPETVLDTYWLLESLRKNADKIAEKCGEKVIFNLADNLKEIFRKKYGHARPTIEFRGNNYRMSIEQTDDFNYSVEIALEKKETREEDLSWKTLESFQLKDCRDAETFAKKVKQGLLGSNNFKDLKAELDKRLKDIYELVLQDFSFMWFRNLFSDPELGIHGTEETLTAILRDITLAKARRNKEVRLKEIFSKFFGPEYKYPIFRRIALFVIGEEWDTYKDYFWQLLDDKIQNLFSSANFEAELYTLLERNGSAFKDEEKGKIKAIIEKGPQREHYTKRQMNYWKQKWYSAVKSDSYFAPLYDKQKKITEVEEQIIFKEPETKWGPGPSPLTNKEIISMPNGELDKYLREFGTNDRWRGSTLDGLCEVLKNAVQERPEKFIDELKPFLNVPYIHMYHMLRGMRDAWTNKKLFDWKNLFEFFKQYIDRDVFWQDKFKIKGDYWNTDHRLVIGMIGEVIQEGTKDDAWAFSEEHFESAKEVVFLILDNLKFKKPEEKEGAVIYALNSTPGKIITALIYLALRIARVEAKKGIKEEIQWSNDLREKYEKLLKDEIIEAYTLLGQYMGNLLYVDKEWVKGKIQSISPLRIDLWEAFMEGYLWASKVHEYELMRKHFLKAIDHKFKEKHIEERLVQYICLGYLGDKENFNENSLFGKLLKRWKASHIEVIIKFFWAHHKRLIMQEDEKKSESTVIPEKDEIIKKIINFWRWVYKKHYKKSTPENISEDDKVILSNLSTLTIFLSQIDSENFEWLKLSARYVETHFNTNFFIEYLDGLKDDKCYVGEIFLEMLNNFVPYLHTGSNIKSIVEHLYEIGEKPNKEKCRESANRICNKFGENGFDFLRDIYERYNPSTKSTKG